MNHANRQASGSHLTETAQGSASQPSLLKVMAQAAFDTLPAAVLLVCLIAAVFAFFR